ncbi:MAG: RluA family pseudouridine synthase [Planctomycetes bacterium]|nr:RluA family pseudouridine synthase [Planctomycetota bacterium]
MRYKSSEGEEFTFKVDGKSSGQRLDVFLADKMDGTSRSFIKRLIDDDLVQVNLGRAKPSYKLKGDEEISLFMPELVEMSAEPEDIHLDVLYDDESMIVINKRPGIVVHPSPGHESGTLVNALLYICNDLSGIGGVLRPGIVHRLDRDTSGCIVVAKTDAAHQELSAQFAARTTQKRYYAITSGVPNPPEGKVEGNMGRHPKHRQKQALLTEGGRYSLTYYKTLENFGDYAFVECDIKTGRTHQIRVHLKSVHAPILCDADYGKADPFVSGDTELLTRQALHARFLSIDHPVTGKRMGFEAPIHDDMAAVLDCLRGS